MTVLTVQEIIIILLRTVITKTVNKKFYGNVAYMDEIIQMTLYYFDKALYNEIIKDWYNQQ